MITVDVTRNVKQQELFNQTMYSIAKKRAGQSDYNKYFFYGGAIRGGKTFCILTILTILCKMFPSHDKASTHTDNYTEYRENTY